VRDGFRTSRKQEWSRSRTGTVSGLSGCRMTIPTSGLGSRTFSAPSAALRVVGYRCYSLSQAGRPDRVPDCRTCIACIRPGAATWIECKRPGGKLRQAQKPSLIAAELGDRLPVLFDLRYGP